MGYNGAMVKQVEQQTEKKSSKGNLWKKMLNFKTNLNFIYEKNLRFVITCKVHVIMWKITRKKNKCKGMKRWKKKERNMSRSGQPFIFKLDQLHVLN